MKFIILSLLIFCSCKSHDLKISLKSDPCQDTQVLLEFAESMTSWFRKDSKASTMALTLATGAYTNCINSRK